jgi:hypothetical protein
MSTATLTPTDDFGRDDLAAFLAQVPAAADYDADEMFDHGPVREHRPARPVAKKRAIDESLQEWR